MKYMLCWSIQPESYNAALDAFLEGGAPMPEGLRSLGRWHAPAPPAVGYCARLMIPWRFLTMYPSGPAC